MTDEQWDAMFAINTHGTFTVVQEALPYMKKAGYGRIVITINGVLPGNILTEGLEGQGQEYLDQMARSIPMHRLGSPRDIGNAAAFLASREAGYITGQTIIIDGGQILPESPEAILPPYKA